MKRTPRDDIESIDIMYSLVRRLLFCYGYGNKQKTYVHAFHINKIIFSGEEYCYC